MKWQDQLRAANSRYVFKLLSEDKVDEIGTCICYPWKPTRDGTPTDIRVVIYLDGEDRVQIRNYKFTGSTLGSLITTENSSNTQVVVFGNGEDDYKKAGVLIDELSKRLKLNSKVLDRFSNPDIQGPAASVAAFNQDNDSTANPTGQFIMSADGMVLPYEKDDGKWEYLTWDPKADLSRFQVAYIHNLIHIMTSVPLSAFGVAPTDSDSSVSMERQMWSATSKVKRLRMEIEEALDKIGLTDLDWVENPFLGFQGKIELTIELLSNGIITENEARKRLGIKGTIEKETPSEPQRGVVQSQV